MQSSKREVYMIDQSDTWRFDMPNLPLEIIRMIIDIGQMFRKNVQFKQAWLGKNMSY